MFTDPFVFTTTMATAATDANTFAGAGSATTSFVCTGRGPTSSTYRATYSSTNYVDLLISRQVGKRNRYTVRLTETELVPDPINSELNTQKTSTVYVVADVGVLGTGTHWVQACNVLARFLLTLDTAKRLDYVLQGQT
jgi:hypothetical protein